MRKITAEKKAISPIIATLLLILIAIAAGVVVYAYVIGFVGNSTGNTGSNQNQISIDQVSVASATASFPVTAFVRNLGPSVESFDVGFYAKSSTLNTQSDTCSVIDSGNFRTHDYCWFSHPHCIKCDDIFSRYCDDCVHCNNR